METFEMSIGGHDWKKQNLVTLGKNRAYDIYKCAKCGITGKSYHIGYIQIKKSDMKKFEKCKTIKTKKIQVTNCKAFGDQFKNITPGSIHEIVPPPEGETNKRGEWVMGVTEPVLLLAGEYIYLEVKEEQK